ncbi:PAS domain S-box-containing protein/diguanylate cyclase (GGDEF) domain-containing protein [Andreprevotia lacus DSM 23236]|jgi:diguanylate cyclase (GGDEF)-like protein/PAS domain S-box-containing protein|uniref:PAS domain S-box-containing protein/diguanylate cyclase (GGDEF) domain-containing protein n=1 Tax=Andreprevotia lacus DSM 23236 TaxID=1121001 RepID=A0A1W1XY13_9NEIS|nr:diguanylate cyclase [Andreprevotia lacus]SMC28792.1 PAS domain S-box-containing protein/diguanylate cyclase (GGDEF) domain-containing protein [Andreprevotia lacus DSM 23236]
MSSLKTKITLCAAVLSIAVVLSLGFAQLHLIRNKVGEVLASQQYGLASTAAHNLDQRLQLTQSMLAGVAELLSQQLAAGKVDYNQFLHERPALAATFDDVMIFAPDGQLLGRNPLPDAPPVSDIATLAHFRQTLGSNKPVISAPYLAGAARIPQIMFTAPVRDRQGRLLAVIGCSFNLLKPNLIGAIGQSRIGKTGYLFLMTGSGTIISHPDAGTLLRNVDSFTQAAPNVAAQGLQQADGTHEGPGLDGGSVLASFARMQQANWRMVAVLPTGEAYAPIREAQQRLIIALAAASLVALLGAWLLMRWLMTPLLQLRDGITRQHAALGAYEPIALPDRQDEIGAVAEAFNKLMADQVHMQDALFAEKERLQITLRAISDPVLTTDAQGRIDYLNPAAERLTGWMLHDARGKDFITVAPLQDEVHGEAVDSPAQLALQQNRALMLEGHALPRRNDGALLAVDTSAAPIHDAEGRIVGIVLVLQDVTHRRQIARQVKWEASHDALTGLPNRREFEAQMADAVTRARRNGDLAALLLIDLDQFKPVNDLGGHAAGDALLVQIARLMAAQVRSRDVVARLGGDEFAVLLNDCAPEKAAQVAEKLRLAVAAQPFVCEARSYAVTTSIGIATISQDSASTDALRHADQACYAAKAAGRNRVMVYREDAMPTTSTPVPAGSIAEGLERDADEAAQD